MKKFITMFLLIFVLLVPFNGLVENLPSPTTESWIQSPTIKSLIKFEPEIDFEFLTQNLTILNLEYWEPFKIFNEYMNNSSDFHLDEALMITITKPIKTLKAKLMFSYKELNSVYAIFITEKECVFVRPGLILKDGRVLFNLKEIEGNIIMFVFSNY